MTKLDKIMVAFLLILLLAKIIVWQIFDKPIGTGSLAVIFLLLLVLKIKNRLTWISGMLIVVSAFLFRDWMIAYLRPVVDNHIFMITNSLLVYGKTPVIVAKSFQIMLALLYSALLFAFLTRTYRVRYGISKEPVKWNFWNRIF